MSEFLGQPSLASSFLRISCPLDRHRVILHGSIYIYHITGNLRWFLERLSLILMVKGNQSRQGCREQIYLLLWHHHFSFIFLRFYIFVFFLCNDVIRLGCTMCFKFRFFSESFSLYEYHNKLCRLAFSCRVVLVQIHNAG